MSALRLAVPTAANRLPRARGAITSLCQELRAEPAIVERVRAAVTEACVICIQRADGGNSDSDTFVLEASTAAGELIIRLSDQGAGIDNPASVHSAPTITRAAAAPYSMGVNS